MIRRADLSQELYQEICGIHRTFLAVASQSALLPKIMVEQLLLYLPVLLFTLNIRKCGQLCYGYNQETNLSLNNEQKTVFPPLIFLNNKKNVLDTFQFFLSFDMIFLAVLPSLSALWKYHIAFSSTQNPNRWEGLSGSWIRSKAYICPSKSKWARAHSVAARASGRDDSCPYGQLLFPPERAQHHPFIIHWKQSLDCAIT